MYYVYILQCSDSSLYTGITTDPVRRLSEHKTGTGGRYTRARTVEQIVYMEESPDRSTASKRESQIKRLSKKAKIELIGCTTLDI